MGFAKWLGASLGWSFGGPIGGLLGFLFGSMADEFTKQTPPKVEGNPHRQNPYQTPPRQQRASQTWKRSSTRPGDFEVSLLILSALVIKADGDISQTELDHVRNYFIRVYGNERANKSFRIFNGVIKHDNVSMKEVCFQIQQHMDHASRLQLIHFLFNVAKSDGTVKASEVDVISTMSGYMGIRHHDFESIKAMFYDTSNNSYRILEIDPLSTDNEVKKAYRKMAKKYHPDRVQHLGEEHVKVAEEKFKEVKKAYEKIQKQRGF